MVVGVVAAMIARATHEMGEWRRDPAGQLYWDARPLIERDADRPWIWQEPPPDLTPDYLGLFPDKPRHAFIAGKLGRLVVTTLAALALYAAIG